MPLLALVSAGLVLVDNPRWIVVEGTQPPTQIVNATTIDNYRRTGFSDGDSAPWSAGHVWRGVCATNGGNSAGPAGQVQVFLDQCSSYTITAIDRASGQTQTLFVPSALDVDQSGNVNSSDFFAWLTHFYAADAAADWNRDGHVNSSDFFEFVNAFMTC